MPFRLRRDDARLGDLLGALADQVVTAAQVLAEVLDGDVAGRAAAAERMRELDHQAEDAGHAVLRALSAAFVTPFDRADVYRVAWAMRVCAGRMEAAAEQILLFGSIDLPSGVSQLVQLLVQAAELTALAVPKLRRPRTLVESWIEITRLGKQAGQLQRHLLAELTSPGADPAGHRADAFGALRMVFVVQGLCRAVEAFEDLAAAFQTVAVTEG